MLWLIIMTANLVSTMLGTIITTYISSTKWYARLTTRISKNIVEESLKGDS